jgi:hypothetical protein
VELVATISPDGAVAAIRTVSGPEPLARPAREVLSKWQFVSCASRSGNCEAKFVFSFALTGSCEAGTRCPTEFEVDLPGKVKVTSKAISDVMN